MPALIWIKSLLSNPKIVAAAILIAIVLGVGFGFYYFVSNLKDDLVSAERANSTLQENVEKYKGAITNRDETIQKIQARLNEIEAIKADLAQNQALSVAEITALKSKLSSITLSGKPSQESKKIVDDLFKHEVKCLENSSKGIPTCE